ncbi:tRNA (N6-threonylcarbamoyladenosine(37)-N6)-methyltransferase TrmO [Gilliamella sp. ESL0250]|uniref:tRNA (N6-threonylcarbamoyladenosine(37)-N6)-methyltransferase TrmO n=1 Tax=Gilliamella sp. ESL0250 TaxID=2705036 RepID=UPI0015810453|nr:tRNA (N6-threonylcarbamoyladenosine(37)-N6)-methyltransferase TrmO [Gilliamella sp. ESL0250]
MMTYQIEPIGIIRSPYSEKFAVPRQPNLVSAGQGELYLLAPYNDPISIKGLEQFSHLWLLFLFHHIAPEKWGLTVRPPRLGGNKTMGVFATRSPFRPNHLGLSAVELKDIIVENKQVILKLGSLDLVDGTPIIDIKPYLPYCDSHSEAHAGYAQSIPEKKLAVAFSQKAQLVLELQKQNYPQLTELITQVISQDPRPAYKQKSLNEQTYGLTLYHFNIRWRIITQYALVEDIYVGSK